MRDEDTHTGPFFYFLGNLKVLLLYQGPRPVCFHTAREKGRTVATGRRKAPCWRPRRLWKVMVVIAVQVEHTEEGMIEWANGGDMWPELLHMVQCVMTDCFLW